MYFFFVFELPILILKSPLWLSCIFFCAIFNSSLFFMSFHDILMYLCIYFFIIILLWIYYTFCIYVFTLLVNSGIFWIMVSINISLCPFSLLSSPEDPIRNILSLFIPSSISCNFPPYFYIFILLISFWAQLFLLLLTLIHCYFFILVDLLLWTDWMIVSHGISGCIH